MNRLRNETSLYLRQHADNPVHWQPWDEAALAEARESGRPILLSIGYSACHWCHVMAHESFEDEATAELMNRWFVNVKVDREERPDLDRVYQLAHQMLSGRGGGWPLTVFLEPEEQVPIFAGTYFPGEPRYGMPSFREVLRSVHEWYAEHRNDLGEQNARVVDALRSVQQADPEAAGTSLDAAAREIVPLAAQQILSRHDAVNGGYGAAPKFPQAPALEAVAVLGAIESGEQLHHSLRFTLEQITRSGLRDHLDGGFFRYCVDADWTIPHFEKMLYDNALLLPLFAEGARRWNSGTLESAARGIVNWLDTEMRQDDGGYAASIDADADGEEGGFHVWTPEQVRAVLGEDAGAFMARYGLDGPANFEGKAWHLQLPRPAGEHDEGLDGFAAERDRLRASRNSRVPPATDDKRLASWNALLAAGLARAGLALDEAAYIDRAEDVLRFIRSVLWTGDGLLAVYNRGRARFEAYLDDYAFLLDALLHLLRCRWSRDWLNFAVQVADAMRLRFEDRENGGFHFSDAAVDVPMLRTMVFQDDATPSGNAMAARALHRLARLLGEPGYGRSADRCIRRALPQLRHSPGGHPGMVLALQEAVLPPPHLVIGANDPEAGASLKAWVEDRYRLDCYLIGAADGSLPGILKDYRGDGPVTAWLCRGLHCLPPAHSRDELKRLLD